MPNPFFRLLIWNVEGLLSKFDEPDFVSLVNSVSFSCLCETFVTNVDLSNLFPEHDCYLSPAKKLSNRGRLSGGVICMVHRTVTKYFTVLTCSYDNVIVFRVHKDFFGTERDVLMFNVYLPPAGSTYYDTVDENNGVEILSNCILNMSEMHNDCSILLCGDLNARTGAMNTTADNLFDTRSCAFDNSRYQLMKILMNLVDPCLTCVLHLDSRFSMGLLTQEIHATLLSFLLSAVVL